MTQFLILMLMLDAALVLAGQLRRWKCTWGMVIAYWAILTVKNAVDFIGGLQ